MFVIEEPSGAARGDVDVPTPGARRAGSPGFHVVALAVFALALWLPLGFSRAGLHGDRAYFTYLGQALLRGEPIYRIDFMAYPPIGHFASAAAMAVGRLFGIPTYLAPRHAALAVALLCVLGVHAVTRRATRNAWAALVAGVALAGFERWAWSAFSTLEPKHLVMLLALAACLALQARRALWAGLASALAVGCYQPAVVVPVAIVASLAWEGRRAPRRPLAAWALGFAAGTLPTLAYLGATGAWWDWWQRGVVIPAASQLPGAGASPWRAIEVVRAELGGDLGLFVLGGIGFAAFAACSLRGGVRGLAEAWLGARNAGMPLLSVLWGAFAASAFGGVADTYVLLPLVAFWAGWAASAALGLVARLAGARSAAATPAGAVVLALATACALRPSAEFLRPSSAEIRGNALANQQRLAAYVDALAGPDGVVVAISAEEFYVLRERPSPLPFLGLAQPVLPFLHLLGLEDCRDALERVVGVGPAVVVVRIEESASDCERGLGAFLAPHGYRQVRKVGRIHINVRTDQARRLPFPGHGSPSPRGQREAR